MSQSIFDKQELTIPCPHCGREIKKSIGWLKRHRQFVCPCGVTTFKADDLIRGVQQVDRRLDKFRRDIRRKFR